MISTGAEMMWRGFSEGGTVVVDVVAIEPELDLYWRLNTATARNARVD